MNQQPSPQKRKLPLPKLPRMAWIILIGSVALLGILVIVALLSGGGQKANSSPYLESLAAAEELNRVSANVKTLSKDPGTQGLAATTSSVMLSNNAELTAYLKKTGLKVDPKSMSKNLDEDIDRQLQEAAQSNRLPEAYSSYLNTSLADYQNLLELAHDQSGTEGKKVINEAYESVKIILSAIDST